MHQVSARGETRPSHSNQAHPTLTTTTQQPDLPTSKPCEKRGNQNGVREPKSQPKWPAVGCHQHLHLQCIRKPCGHEYKPWVKCGVATLQSLLVLDATIRPSSLQAGAQCRRCCDELPDHIMPACVINSWQSYQCHISARVCPSQS